MSKGLVLEKKHSNQGYYLMFADVKHDCFYLFIVKLGILD